MDARRISGQLTIKEKAELCFGRGLWHFRGIERFGLKEIMVCDGPHGLRKQEDGDDGGLVPESSPATCFPVAAALASSWNRELIGKVGAAIARECIAEGISILLGPGANIKRSPLCGRNFEYFSEDPFLSGEAAAAMIKGIQNQGVGSSLKHFAANNQETLRMTIDSIVDERTLREIYLAGFETAVKKSMPWSVMCAYNRVNGDYAAENRYLLTEILREQWGFGGIVITDWGANNSRTAGIAAGQDIEMPGSGPENIRLFVKAVESDRGLQEALDCSAERIIDLLIKSRNTLDNGRKGFDAAEHHNLARRAAAESVVLLKNTGGALPLKPDDRIAVAGGFAVEPRYQGAGSSRVNPFRLDRFLDEIRKDYPGAAFAESCTTTAGAAALAAEADKIVVLAGLPDEYESEGFDRQKLKLPKSHNRLIKTMIKTGKPVIVCLSNGGPVQMPWNNDAAAVVECYLSGQAGAGALADILTGRTNPSGKLAESFPEKLEDNPSFRWFPGGPRQSEYREGLYVGYRYYDTAGIKPLYPFGHGLSYTEFEYSSLKTEKRGRGEDFKLEVSLSLKNTGTRPGSETAQLYISAPERSVHSPVKELKGFEKISLAAGQEKEISFSLDLRAFSYYSTEAGGWIAEAGRYDIIIGASSADERLRAGIQLTGDEIPAKQARIKAAGASDYSRLGEVPGLIHSISDPCFEQALGRRLPKNIRPREYNRNTTLNEFSNSLAGKILLKFALKKAEAESAGNENSAGMYTAMIKEMPLRAVVSFSNGRLGLSVLDAIIEMANGRKVKGLTALVKTLLSR